jgi:hypothetical protein
MDSDRKRPREMVARAIYDATDKLSGDSIATVIVASDHLFPLKEHQEGNSAAEAYRLAAMEICREAADAAISKLRDLGYFRHDELALIKQEEGAE